MGNKEGELKPVPVSKQCPVCAEGLVEKPVPYLVGIEYYPRLDHEISVDIEGFVCDPCGLIFYDVVPAMEKVRAKIQEIAGESPN